MFEKQRDAVNFRAWVMELVTIPSTQLTIHPNKTPTGQQVNIFMEKNQFGEEGFLKSRKCRLVIHEYIVSFVLCWSSDEAKNNINMWGMCLWLSFDLKSPLIKQ